MVNYKSSTLVDSFVDVALSPCWTLDDASANPLSGGSTAVFGGPGAALHADAVGSQVNLKTTDRFDFVDDVCGFHFDPASFSGGPGPVTFHLAAIGYDAQFYFELPSTFLVFDTRDVFVDLSPGVMPEWCRFRHDSGTATIYWETSTDGSSWTVIASATNFPLVGLNRTRPFINVNAGGSGTDVTVLEYNGGGTPICGTAPPAPGASPPYASLKDSFVTSVLSPCWEDNSFGSGSSSGAGPGLVLSAGGDSGSGGGVDTVDWLSLDGTAVTIEITTLPTAALSSFADFTFFYGGAFVSGFNDFSAQIRYTPNTGVVRASGGDSTIGLSGTSGLLAGRRFWRFRGSGNEVWADVSSDGISWDALHSWLVNDHGQMQGAIEMTTFASDVTIATFDGGGVPSCPSAPASTSGLAMTWAS